MTICAEILWICKLPAQVGGLDHRRSCIGKKLNVEVLGGVDMHDLKL